MRKILLSLIIVLLLAFGISAAVNGTQMGEFKIYSVKEISDKNAELDAKIEEANTLRDVNYPAKREELTTASKKMRTARVQYLNETESTSEEELDSALKIKNYDIEKLWAVIGNHAIDQGVNLTMEVKPGSSTETRNLEFTIIGTYLGQLNFLYAIEGEEILGFRVYNYKLYPYANDGIVLKGTFTFKDIRITLGETNPTGVPDPEGSMNEKLNSKGNVTSTTSTQTSTSTPTPTPTQTPGSDGGANPTPTPTQTPGSDGGANPTPTPGA